MKTVPIAYHGDLYQVTINITNEIIAVEVSRGNRNRPFMDMPLSEVPEEVLVKLENRTQDE